MSGLIYYIKGRPVKPTESDLKQAGFAGSVASFVGCNLFLDGSQGSIFTIKGKEDGTENVGYYKDVQHWVKVSDISYIGIASDNKPTPETFKKKDAINGKMIVLGDDNEWQMPIARRIDVGSILPKSISMVNGDEVVFVPLSKFIPLHNLAEQIEKEMFQENILPSFMEWKDIFKACCTIIQANYNLTVAEISALGLITTANFMALFENLIDFEYVVSVLDQKKKG